MELSRRQRLEKDYHDNLYSGSNNNEVRRSGESAYKFYWKFLDNVRGLSVLDFGCGNGWLSVQLAKKGARVSGIDISEELIKKARELAERHSVTEKIDFRVMPGENLAFAGGSFDLVIGSAILHHTDIDATIDNVRTVLKPGGMAVFIEPMNQNIFLKIWRMLTPWRRSPAEKALTVKDLKLIKDFFPDTKYHFFNLTSILTEGLMIAAPGSKVLRSLNNVFVAIDNVMLKAFPFIGRYCAVVVMELRKSGRN